LTDPENAAGKTPEERHEELADTILRLIELGADPREALHSASLEPDVSIIDIVAAYDVIQRRERDAANEQGERRGRS
jgi:hypothetical protein